MGQRSMAILLSGFLFLGVYLSGFSISAGKPLWLDEHYSITKSITTVSYRQILQGGLDWESSRSPLFYASQKFLCDLVAYDPRYLMTLKSRGGTLFYGDPFSNVYLRLISLFFMALAPAALFYYFYRRYSWGWGSFAALLCLSSWLFWWYGLEARPYIHFLALTTLQGIIFLEIFRQRTSVGKIWIWFGVVNWLLAFTMTTCVFQIALMGVACAVYFRKSLAKIKILLVFILPIVIALYYHSFGLQGRFRFGVPLYTYYLSAIPWDIVVISVIFFVYAGFSWLDRDEKVGAMPIAFLAIALSAVYFSLMVFMKTAGIASQGGSPFAHRYLINLVPIGIMAMTIFSRALFQSFKDDKMKVAFIAILAAVLVWRFIYTYGYVHSWLGI